MTGVKRSSDPSVEFKLNILEGEVESNETLLKNIESKCSNDSEDYEFSNGYQMDILRWIEDIKEGNSEVLTNDDLEFRMDILNNQIECHEDVLENDDSHKSRYQGYKTEYQKDRRMEKRTQEI